MDGDNPVERINLVMGGGGSLLPAYVGGLAAVESMGVEVLAIAGASAGSIVGSFLAAGWSVDRMRQKVMETDFTRFKDLSLKGLMLAGGLYSGKRFEQWLDDALDGATFGDLPRDLYVATIDLIGRRPFIFSRYTTPDEHVSRAVRSSMAIPWIWQPLRWERRLLVDGQLMPWILEGLELMRIHAGETLPQRTVMLRLVSEPLSRLQESRYLFPWNFAAIIMETMLGALENQRVPGALWQDTVIIDCGNTRTLDLALTTADKDRLWQCGYEQTRRYYHKERIENASG